MKLFFLILSLQIFGAALGQSQKETQDWILAKLNKYKEPSYNAGDDVSFTSIITKVSFTNCQLDVIITNEGSRKTNGRKESFKTTSTIKIPITKLIKMNYNKLTHQLLLETENENIAWVTYDPKISANNQTNYVQFFGLSVNLNTEKDLSDRMSNAFKQLVNKYCTKSDLQKEAF